MYQNGKQLNRYAAKMIHKQTMKRQYLNKVWGFGLGQSWEDYAAHCSDPWYLRYWKLWDFTGSRAVARWCSNKKLRAEFREDAARADWDNIYAPQCGNYTKHVDYWWTVF